ncbi:MAG: hypothetical protein AAF215_00495 [Cyanobacteria bacterium P01_A01_bin.123]
MSIRYEQSVFFRGYLTEIWLRLWAYFIKGFKNPSWIIMSILGRFTIIRYAVVAFLRSSKSKDHQPKNSLSIFRDINVTEIVNSLNQNGLYLGIQLPQNHLNRIFDFALSTTCYGNQNSRLGFYYSEKGRVEKEHGYTFFMAQYYNTSVLCSEIYELSRDSQLLEIAASYLRAKPIFTGSRLWWTFAVNDEQPYDSNQTITFFHYDLDDYACLRFFFYLTDVDSKSGPHICVRGSHTSKKLSHVLMPVKRRGDDEIRNSYGSDNIVTVIGNKGFGFAEDTFCYHKATRPICRDRLMLQIQFATSDYGLHNDLKDPSLLRQIA